MLPDRLRGLLGPLLFFQTVLVLFATEKLDLTRIMPVPADEPIPAMDFFRNSILQRPELNRSGTYVAAIVLNKDDDQRLMIYEVATQKIDGILEAGVRSYSWLSDKRLLFDTGAALYAADAERSTATGPLLTLCSPLVIGVPKGSPLRPLIWIRSDYFDSGQIGSVVTVNTEMGEKRTSKMGVAATAENNQSHITDTYPVPPGGLGYGYLADKEGELAFGFTSQDGVLAMHRLMERHWEKCPVDLDTTDIVTCGNKQGEVVVLTPNLNGKPRALQFMDAATGHLGEVLLQDNAYDFDGWLYRDPGSHDIVGAAYERNGPKVVWFSEGYRTVQKTLDGFFPGLVVRIISNDESGRRYLVSTYSDRQPEIFYLVDLDKHAVGLFKNSKPWIDPKRMQPTSMMKYKTRDGRELDAYVTLPTGASKKNPPPLVVLAHDGPWNRDTWGFNGEVQFLVNRGYAVIQPNYRGSSGYNWMFPENDQWAFRKMSDDVIDATKTLISSGLVDSDRIAILGWGFGGYLAVAGVVNEPLLYRCAVAIDGLFDWTQLVREQKYYQFDSPSYGRLVRKLGDPKQEKDKFDSISPARHIDRVRVPVFVVQNKQASGAALAQSRQLNAGLEEHHIPHEFVTINFSGNGREWLKSQVELYTHIEAFLINNLGRMRPKETEPAVAH